MRSVYNKSKILTNEEIYSAIMRAKGEIDTIREDKNLEDYHALSRASEYLEQYLDELDRQKNLTK